MSAVPVDNEWVASRQKLLDQSRNQGERGREREREREREKKKWARVLTSVSGFQRNHTKIILYKGLQF